MRVHHLGSLVPRCRGRRLRRLRRARSAQKDSPLYKDRAPADRAARRRPALAHDAGGEGRPDDTVWEQKAEDADARRRILAGKASQAFPERPRRLRPPLGPSRRHRVARRRGRRRPAVNRDARARPPTISMPRSIGRSSTPGSASRCCARGSAARLCRARRDQLPAGDRAGQHLGPGLWSRASSSVAAREMRARGATLALAPVVDVARDPRWGRIEETYGEDPYLVSEMGARRDPRLPGHDPAAARPTRCSPRSSI